MYEELCALGQDLKPDKGIIISRYRFYTHVRSEDQNAVEFAADLRRLARPSKFGTVLADMLQDFFVIGINQEVILLLWHHPISKEEWKIVARASVISTLASFSNRGCFLSGSEHCQSFKLWTQFLGKDIEVEMESRDNEMCVVRRDCGICYLVLNPFVFQVIFLLCAYVTIYLIYIKYSSTFDRENDTFRIEFILVPVAGLSFLVNHDYAPLEIFWTFSIYLESVAILPQLFMITKTGEAETITSHYLFFLGVYRALYLANWIWRYHTEGFFDQIAVVSGVVQTIFYCDFFYLYITKVLKGKNLGLPLPI
uniref:ER lumen protein-retaining receptor 1-like n=1 Tax=Pristiophorus japonicus TaxID=55135 RepID=UPI00398F455E